MTRWDETLDALENPFWHALSGPQAAFGHLRKDAARYERSVAVFAALRDDTPDAWNDLSALYAPGEVSVLFRPTTPTVPSSWSLMREGEPLQLVQLERRAAPSLPGGWTARLLTADDAPAMQDLVRATKPGPFAERTVELGGYTGVWNERDGEPHLVAMAGLRAALPSAREISAVCTHPEYRRLGLARALVAHLASELHARDILPFLHVDPDNEVALRTYATLGFVERRKIRAIVLRRAPDEAARED
ncbi:GNAT family N-acetyltransferase [Deinococcus yavapaiensis]|uniref:Putative GNAT family acetyltransferase n=1 Tax=Deinococcus yavapaiensis KR-236 TaxID=694435 RepID=A0A318S2R5_9DEIO|nr:GNAT family N-acetyltransferase [Deinococcus yavapaiensis]PYE52742.1 putative GNAT family acetyltransferase [Deinococcus yavapaiensis KR-236]